MFRRSGAVTRSLHAPHGININALDKNPRMKRKLSWSSPKVRNAASEGGLLTHKPMVLKEGFLYKPGFLRLGGRKRRWCVLRTYSPTEASIDIYMDDTKSRFKGTISLDKDLCPMLIVKNYDSKKKSPKNVYLVLKIGKRTYQFTTDSFRELKGWSALLRQAIDYGLLFSGKITEPLNIEDGMVNVKFNSNCIAVLCPIRETAIKTWRLNHITSFGQCGGILTYECCSTCSDPGTSRCSINIIQEKSSTVLNLMEKAIRSNPNTSEIHYERSILGDIYHCDHDCGQPQRLLPAYSDPNLFRSTSTSPQKEVVHIDINDFEIPFSTLSSGKSNDSGFPHDAVSMNSNSTPSPTDVNNKSSYVPKHGAKINVPPLPPPNHGRSMSDIIPEEKAAIRYARRMSHEAASPSTTNRLSRLHYSDVDTNSPPYQSKFKEPVQYSLVRLSSSQEMSPQELSSQEMSPSKGNRPGNKLQPVDENEGIYDTPFEPVYWEVTDNGLPPLTEYRLNSSVDFISPPKSLGKFSAQSTSSIYVPGSDAKDRDEDYGLLPPVPSRHRRTRPKVMETVNLKAKGRSRLYSTGDVLDNPPIFHKTPRSKFRGSVDNLTKNYLPESHSDLLKKLHEQEEQLSKFLARSRNERNYELRDTKEEELIRPYKNITHEEQDSDMDADNHLYASPTHLHSGRSSSASDRGIDRLLTKVASDTVRGYAYKIQIPLSNREYDVPRRAAPAPNLSNLRSDAPPKPLRYTTSTEP